jgi:hypothetical protein
MRTSDAERQRVAEFLRDACADGRLSPDELEERLDALFVGSTVADIAVLVSDLPGGYAVVPRLGSHRARRSVTPVPARRRQVSPAVPIGVTLLVVGIGGLVLSALPPLLAILMAAIALSVAIALGMLAVALAPVGFALFGLAWLINRVLRGRGAPPGPWAGSRHGRHPFL